MFPCDRSSSERSLLARSPLMFSLSYSLPLGLIATASFSTTAAASGTSAVMTRSFLTDLSSISLSALSKPCGTDIDETYLDFCNGI